MEYSATFKSMLGLTIILLFIGLFGVGVGIQSGETAFIVIGSFTLALLLIIRVRFRVVITDDEIVSTGFFNTKRIKLNEITGGCGMEDYGYPKDRYYGPFVYEIRTTTKTMRINLKLFPIECGKTILNLMAKRTNR